MRRLMLLRHAKTEHHAPSGHDQDRRLDERGRLDAAAHQRVAQGRRDLGDEGRQSIFRIVGLGPQSTGQAAA